MIGPTIIIDKSVLEGLNPEEAKLLNSLFYINITPVLFLEVAANIKEKPRHKGMSPEANVRYC